MKFATAHKEFATAHKEFATAHKKFATAHKKFATAHKEFATAHKEFTILGILYLSSVLRCTSVKKHCSCKYLAINKRYYKTSET